jgi:hypothetical protein
MGLRSFTRVLAVTVATAILPLACGEDDSPSPGDDGASGSGAQTGGNAATGGGPGGEGGATGGNVTTGGTGGSATGGNVTGGNSTGGRAGNSTGGAGETSGGEGGASGADGTGGASDGGEGGEDWYDESLERAKRICNKTEPLGCEEHSHCIENYRWGFARWPNCQEENERLMICFDTQTTIEDFACWGGVPMPTGEAHCQEELEPFEYECF